MVTTAFIEQVHQLAATDSAREIARKLNCSRDTVRKILLGWVPEERNQGEVYEPSPAEIRRKCRELQKTWSEERLNPERRAFEIPECRVSDLTSAARDRINSCNPRTAEFRRE